ncbi:MAG: hypothetical protein ACPHYF_09590, partial [Akkermansiaceae bacterium]
RWPEETGYAITAGIQGTDVDEGPEALISPTAADWYRDGKALAIDAAALKIDERSWQQDVAEHATQVTFKVSLDKGPHRVRAWFTGGLDVRAETILTPYFLTIKRVQTIE